MQILFEVYKSSGTFSGTFDKVLYNIGNGWVVNNNNFKAPQTGLYYLSYSAGGLGTGTKMFLRVGSNYYCENDMYEAISGMDMISRGCFLSLNSANTVTVYTLVNGDSTYGEASFKGFLYSPLAGNPVAWSVHTSSYLNPFNGIIPYNLVFVNTPNTVWRSSTYTAVIPATGTGIYYMEIVSYSMQGGIDMEIMLNGNTLLTRLLLAFWSRATTRSRSTLAHLNGADQLHVMCYNCHMDGAGYTAISFQGFLLFPA